MAALVMQVKGFQFRYFGTKLVLNTRNLSLFYLFYTNFFIIILACPSKRDSGFALAIELDDKGKGLVDWKEV